ncbi:MAG: isoleucine--tRNA ligase [Candidatus Omnitrophica bacterium]|nr:isoleucine--tRNA ligase [Candidatus Omnitrophota bacterium]
MSKEKTKNYKETLNLPKTSFPMKASLPTREPEILKKWQESAIYSRILDSRSDAARSFILHDGPPYANGHIHMGHVLNKMLKDICVKYYTMQGFRAPYIPGWDCHGLPVEHQLFKELNISKHDIDQVKFRKKAYKYAMKFVSIQSKEFERLGVFGDWQNPYLTLTKDYEADILASLAELYRKGYIYKDLKPVNWCKECETALAEAEVEYEEKTSPSIYVKFKAAEEIAGRPVYFVIWTTTPWTLLANVAVALHPDFTYAFVQVAGQVWVMDEDRAEHLMKKAGVGSYRIIDRQKGREVIQNFEPLEHPFMERESVLVPADYVTKEDGTGCVHTAPGHGQEDYLTGKKHGLPVIMPVDDRGRFREEAGDFAGEDVIKANKGIIEKMRREGSLIYSEEVRHSYPHCWRCKKPIIFRATEQWFMSIDHDRLRDRMARAIKQNVHWIPPAGEERIGAMVKMRPDWCLSRQRYWGVPIPAFKCEKCGEAFTSAEVIQKVSDLTREAGADVWFEKSLDELLPEDTKCGCGSDKFKKEDNILDVWFDSGVSHKAVIDARAELSYPADLYLEGSDQHRGWFQAALITAMATKGEPPYRKVLTHGFVVDGEGKKMSKSVGNVISPDEVMKKYGADILRLWVASSDYVGDIKLSGEILERLADGYRKIRNTFRFLLSNLYDFDPETDRVPLDKMEETDRWMLSSLYGLTEKVTRHYDNWEFYRVYRAVYDFCVYEVSAFYLDVMKDLLYILSPDDSARRSAQTVMYSLLHTLVRIVAPILSFTAEEVWSHLQLKGKAESVHMSYWPDIEKEMPGWEDKQLDAKWEQKLRIRDHIMKSLEVKREQGLIGSSLEAKVTLYSKDGREQSLLEEEQHLLSGLFKVSQTRVSEKDEEGMEDVPGTDLRVKVERASGQKCQRCWNYSENVGKNKEHPDLCQRCYNVISERSDNG